MDILAHSLWAGAGLAVARRHVAIDRRTVAATIVLAALPDVFHFLPVLGWGLFGDGTLAQALAYATALPGQAPGLPPLAGLLTHHLHCTMHSAVVASAVTLVLWAMRGSLWMPLLGWWSHIIIDVFTHSADFYPSPVLYPLTYRGFDGLAWNTPWFMLLNYAALAAVFLWVALARQRPVKP